MYGLVDAEAVLAEAADGQQAVLVGADVDVGFAAEVLDVGNGAGDGAGSGWSARCSGRMPRVLPGAPRASASRKFICGLPMKPAAGLL